MKNAGRGVLMGLIFVLPILGAAQSAEEKATTPGELMTDDATMQSLAFRWLIRGDDNGNGVVTVKYRKKGSEKYRDAMTLLRVNRETVDREHDPFRCGNLFAGSILFLEPNTEYEVTFTLVDPDGGEAVKGVTAKTTSIPVFEKGDRQVHVYPAGFSGKRETPAFADLATSAREARPGDVILLHKGVYKGTVEFHVRGTKEKPILFRAAGNGEVVIDGGGVDGNIIEAQEGNHFLAFEGLTIRNGRTAIKANGSNNLVVRRCRIVDVDYGIVTYSTDTVGWYIVDNTITGRIKNWYPREEREETGINVVGRGHVVCHNRVSHFWDGISTSNYGGAKASWATDAQPPQMAIDICHNDCSELLDDGIEADHALHNIRVFENRVTNAHVGLSAQPHLGGPLYFIRNAIYNVTAMPLKLHNYPTGLVILHNTCVSAGQAFESWPPAWQNALLRNNLFLGAKGYAMETGSSDRRTSLDYNGYRKTGDSEGRFLKWSGDGGKTWVRSATLAEFTKATGHEAHGVMVDFDIFLKAALPVEGKTYNAGDLDLRLKPGCIAVDAGVVIPNVNDTFLGKSPDLGASEQGASPPRYGPREEKE